jgi:hypothetical protein
MEITLLEYDDTQNMTLSVSAQNQQALQNL